MRYILIVFIIITSFTANSFTLRDDYPRRYTIQEGDTLWSISSKYLHHPWEWKNLWEANPRIKNPNRLYPGAVIELRFYQQKPYLHVLSNGTIKLSPYMRRKPLGNPVLPIPLMDIKPFLNASRVLDEDWLVCSPYIVALKGEHMLGGQGDEIYVKSLNPDTKSLPPDTTISYAVYRPGPPYISQTTKENLGYMATLVGYADLVRGGDPAVILLTQITEGVKLKDRVIVNDFPEFNLYFVPKTPNQPVEGRIIDLPPAFTQGAVGLIVVLDKGKNAGLEAGDVLGLYSPNHLVPDPLRRNQLVMLPRERIGEVMIFRTFSKTSFALVVRSINAVHKMDIVTNP